MRSNRRFKASVGVIAVLMVAALLPLTAVTAQSGETGMFTQVADGRAYTPPAHVMRSRTVAVDMGTLFTPEGKVKTRATIGEVTFNLFPDVTFTGRVTGTTQDKFAKTWSGTLTDVAGGYFSMVVADGAFAAHFASSDGIYEVHSAGDGVYRVVQIDQSKFVDHPPGSFDDPAVGEVMSDAEVQALEADGRAVDSGATIDILVMYTTEAETASGGEAAMHALIALALAETNQGYQQSKVDTRLRLVHVEETGFSEASFNDALTQLVNGTGGLGVAHTLRDTYGADLVGMIIADGAYCGLAAGILPGEAWAFQVTDYTCATGYYSFGHEFGHLQGARHDIDQDGTMTPYAYGHGYTNPPDHWRTVMAYNDACAATGGCTRLLYWSNPNKNAPPFWGSDPMGNASAKNFKVLDATAYQVANYRKSKGADFYSSFDVNNKGWAAVVGTWFRNTKGWYTSKGKLNKFATAYHGGFYGDITFEAVVKRVGDCAGCATMLVLRGKSKNVDGTGNWIPSYQFIYNNSGSYSVWKIKPNGGLAALKGWTAHAAIKPFLWNKLKVVAIGGNLSFYINNQLVWSGSDAQFAIGQVGLGFFKDGTANNRMMVNWAKVTTTATADAAPDQVFDPVVEIEAPAGANQQS